MPKMTICRRDVEGGQCSGRVQACYVRVGARGRLTRVGSVCTHCFTLTPAEGAREWVALARDISAAPPVDLDDLRARLEARVRQSEGEGDRP